MVTSGRSTLGIRTTRREAIRVATAFAAQAPAAGFGRPRSSLPDPLDGVGLYRDVLEYCGMGEHRSGSAVDAQTVQWLFDRLQAAGLRTDREAEPFRAFNLQACSVTVDSATLRGYPEWYPTATGPVPVTAPLALLEAGAPLATLKDKIWLTYSASGIPNKGNINDALREQVDAAGRAGAKAAIIVVRSLSGALVGRNAADPVRSQSPWCSIPMVGVAGAEEAMLVAAAQRGAPASVLVHGTEVPAATGYNVVGRCGSGTDLIIVTTPHSGMFRCGGERAPGVALFLGLAAWAAKRRPSTRYLFCATYGHEIAGRGVDLFERRTLPPKEQVKCWLHLGSGAGVWRFEREGNGLRRHADRGGVGNFLASEPLIPLLRTAFTEIPDLVPTKTMTGDLAPFLAKGYMGFGPSGSNIFTHTDVDGPEQTAPEILAPLARGLARALAMIEARPAVALPRRAVPAGA